MTTWAVIPVKAFGRAKSRLTHFSPAQRADLARELFEHVLSCVQQVASIAGVLVLTNGDEVARRAGARGAEVVRDGGGRRPITGAESAGHLGRVVDAGLAHLATRAVDSAVVLMADLPDLACADVSQLVDLARTYPMVVAPDSREQGTNALALSPVSRLTTCFGHADSLARHLALADRCRLEVRVYRSPTLARDIDLPTDL